jgi:hypothetical protein
VTAAQIRAAVTERLTTAAGTQTQVGPHARWTWQHGQVQAALDVYTTGAVGFWCQLGIGPEVRLIGQGLTVAQVLGALDLAATRPDEVGEMVAAIGEGGRGE